MDSVVCVTIEVFEMADAVFGKERTSHGSMKSNHGLRKIHNEKDDTKDFYFQSSPVDIKM